MSRDLISDLISEDDHFTDIFYFGFGQVREALIKSGSASAKLNKKYWIR